ncbi:MAG: nucleoside hydrolase [Pirellulaceae bacterium]
MKIWKVHVAEHVSPLQILPRRRFLLGVGASLGSFGIFSHGVTSALRAAEPERPTATIPFIHTTDLYHPPQDPDDHVDLATVFALPELDLRAVILDPTHKFVEQQDPGYVPVAQLNYLTGRGVPVAAGPIDPLQSPSDTAKDRPRREQAGIELLLQAISLCSEPAFVSVMGSARAVAAAWNREPQLLQQKVRAVLVNAGATTGKPGAEWNVDLDVHAWVALMRSGLPILWYPCTGEHGPTGLDSHNTYWPVSHQQLFDGLPQPIRAYFDYAFNHHARGDIVRALSAVGDGPSWEKVLAGQRNMWSTASLIMAAGRVLAQTSAGWRFVAQEQAGGLTLQPLEMLSIRCEVDDNGVVGWSLTPEPSNVRIFCRKPDEEHVRAMGEATNALLRQIPLG